MIFGMLCTTKKELTMNKKFISLLILLFGILLLQTSFAITNIKPKQHFIIDTDMDFDDWLAIIYMLNQQDISVDAITVVGTGAASCSAGVKNAKSIIKLTGKSGIEVSCGREKVKNKPLLVDNEYRRQVDKLYDINLPNNNESIYQGKAVDLLSTQLKTQSHAVNILAIGPLTNIADLIEQNPLLAKQKIDRLYIMGGAISVAGNIHDANPKYDNRTAEWNIFADVAAADKVFSSGIPITLIPLDATAQVPITNQFYGEFQKRQKNPKAQFSYQVLSKVLSEGPSYFWDPLAAVVASQHSVATFENKRLKVITSPGSDYGRITITDDGWEVQVCTDINKKIFYQQLADGIAT
jgi:inosine-uridine nucleoside N-ribohydrolase